MLRLVTVEMELGREKDDSSGPTCKQVLRDNSSRAMIVDADQVVAAAFRVVADVTVEQYDSDAGLIKCLDIACIYRKFAS